MYQRKGVDVDEKNLESLSKQGTQTDCDAALACFDKLKPMSGTMIFAETTDEIDTLGQAKDVFYSTTTSVVGFFSFVCDSLLRKVCVRK